MASEAEVELLISTAGALPELERDLSRIIRQTENDADAIDVSVAINAREAARTLSVQLDQAASAAEGQLDGIEVGVLIDQRDALRTLDRQLSQIVDDTNRRIEVTDPLLISAVLDGPQSLRNMRTELGRVVASVERTAPDIEVEVDLEVDEPRFQRINQLLGRLGEGSRSALGGVTPLALGVGKLGVAVGAAIPAVSSLVTTLLQVAPAAAVGTSAMLAMRLTAGTLAIAMIGVSDAIERAFDPELSPDEFHKSLKDLAPEARLFVDQLHTMRRELRGIQQGVQNRVFRDLDEVLVSLGQRTAPVVTNALNQTANSLNAMAKETALAANRLSSSGILGQALDGATQGLQNLEAVPGRLATSFTVLAAGAAPAFDRITRAIDAVTARIQEKLLRSLDDGSLQRAIDGAVSSIDQLFTILGNFGEAASNIFGGLTQNGGGLFDVLEKVSEAFVKLTASKEFQTILEELSLTVGELVDAALPLIKEALIALAPVIAELAPLVREFIKEIGPELIPVIQELAPLLLDLVKIVQEQLPFAIEFTKAALQTLTFVLGVVHRVMEVAIIPIVRKVADVLNSDFVRAIAAASRFATGNVPLIGDIFGRMRETVVTAVNNVLVRLGRFVLDLKSTFVRGVANMISDVVAEFERLPSRILGALFGLIGDMTGLGSDAIQGFANGLVSGVGRVIGIARSIADSVSSTIENALDIGSPSKVTARLGRDTVEGFAVGMRKNAGLPQREARLIAEGVVATLRTAVGPSLRPGAGPSLASRTAGPTLGRKVAPVLQNFPQPTLAPALQTTPVVNVYIGNKLVEQFVSDRIRAVIQQRDRTIAQGVRI